MRLSWTFTLAACLAAGGCATGSGAQWEDYYTLGPAPPAAVAATPPAGSDQAGARPSLRVERIGAPAWLQSPRIYYRLLYHEGSEVAAYSRSRWVASVPALVGQRLRAALAGGDVWKAVVGPASTAHTDLLLRLDLVEFEQEFSTPKQSRGVMRLHATLVRNASHTVLAETTLHCTQPAPTADAQGAAAALGGATRKCAAALEKWARAHAPAGQRSGASG